MSKQKSVFIGATGQNVGKTTLCLGLIAALKKRYDTVGFIKPVGQQHVTVDEGIIVDKDVVLFKEYFRLQDSWTEMSPVIIPNGFTRDFLNQKITEETLLNNVKTGFKKIHDNNAYTIVEGTGHIGVGSIINMNNARVSAELGLDMVIIASGGLGSAFDELTLNIALCKQYGVKIRGVILNRVLQEKRSMILDYFPKALRQWDVPLIGAIPFNEFLSTPAIKDFETLFNTTLISGERHRYRHFHHSRLVAGSVESYETNLVPNELIITPASRLDIIRVTLETHKHALENGMDYQGGMILTSRHAPSQEIIEYIKQFDVPVLYAPLYSYDAMKMITSFIAKIRTEDTLKVEKAIQLVENFVNFDLFTNSFMD